MTNITIASNVNRAAQTCSRCVLDTTVPSIRFDASGVCNFCHSHDLLLRSYPRDEKVMEQRRNALINEIKKEGMGQRYDCIVGISGGTDSTDTLYLVKSLGLRPLAVHLDDGWNSTIAVTNIHNAVKKLDVDLETVVFDLV